MRLKITLMYALLTLGVLALNGCSSFSKVYSEEEPGANLFQYYSYKWLPNNGILPGDPVQVRVSEQTENRIRNSVDNYMSKAGFRLCDSSPDLLLHYHVVIKNQVSYQRDWECDDSHSASPHAYCQRVRPVYFREGTLIIDFMDALTGNQVWRGVAIGIIDQMTPVEIDTRIENAVREIFKKFPVKPQPAPQGHLSAAF